MLWSDETYNELFGTKSTQCVWRKRNDMTQRTPPNSQTRRWKHYSLGLFLCQGYRRTSPYWGANGHVEEKLLLSAKILKIGHGWVIQHDNGQKDTVKTTKEWLQKKKHIEVMGMAFPYPYPEEHCGGSWSFKFLSSSQETYMIKRVSIDKWAKVPPEMWVNLVTNYKKATTVSPTITESCFALWIKYLLFIYG